MVLRSVSAAGGRDMTIPVRESARQRASRFDPERPAGVWAVRTAERRRRSDGRRRGGGPPGAVRRTAVRVARLVAPEGRSGAGAPRRRRAARRSPSRAWQAAAMEIGTIGIWRRHQAGLDAVEEIEDLGFGALWLGGSPSLAQVRPFLE